MFYYFYSNAQYTIKGSVSYISGTSVSGASVTLNGKESPPSLTYTDDQGLFVYQGVHGGQYMLVVSIPGASDTTKVALQGDTTIAIRIRQRQLDEVVVNVKKPLIQREVDRFVFNVDNSYALRGTDIFDALKTAPLVKINDDQLSIVGKSGVSLMMNGKILKLPAAEIVNYLRTIRTDDVSRIEVITTPPSNFEAEGNSGIINIVTKKRQTDGLNGSASISARQATYSGFRSNAGLNLKAGKLNLSAQLFRNDGKIKSQEYLDNPDRLSEDNIRKDRTKNLGGNLEIGYEIDPDNTVGLQYYLSNGSTKSDISTISNYFGNGGTDSILSTQGLLNDERMVHTANIFYEHKLDSTGKRLNFAANYNDNEPDNSLNFNTSNLESGYKQNVKTFGDLRYRIVSAQGDSELPFGSFKMTTGIKFTNILNTSDVKYFDLVNETYVLNNTKSNKFRYRENNYAAYLDFQKTIGEKFEIKTGIRYEYTDIEGHSPEEGTRQSNRYGNVFPTMFITYSANDNQKLSFNYTKRISRPSFNMLNPFKWYNNPYSYSQGNPLLSPSYNQNLELSWVNERAGLSASLYLQKTTDGFGQLTFLDESVLTSRYENYFKQYTTGLNINYVFEKLNWWQSDLSVNLYHVNSKEIQEGIGVRSQWSCYIQSNNTLFLDEGKSNMLFVNYAHNFPEVGDNTKYFTHAYLDIGAASALFKKKVNVRLMLEDVFSQYWMRGVMYMENNNFNFRNYYDARRLSLTFTYNFGGKKADISTPSVDFEENNRAN
uniref:TonB-dependent receptor n=1 Tax=Sphingobacterium sp. (strain 21) TaxID=743722 RepID=F4C9T4_SPHS2